MSLDYDGWQRVAWEPVADGVRYQVEATLEVAFIPDSAPLCTLPPDARREAVPVAGDSTGPVIFFHLPSPGATERLTIVQANISADAFSSSEVVVAHGETVFANGGGCPTARFYEPQVIEGCTVPAGYIEVTTAAARERGQRVFGLGFGSGAERWYAGGGVCVHLAGAIEPIPEFAPTDIQSFHGIAAGDPPPARLSLPATGTGSGGTSRLAWLVGVCFGVGTSCVLCGLWPLRRSVGAVNAQRPETGAE
jgi:hypothetical protein